jgi:selenocysteine lyase/cysteine desulfurase
LDLNDLQTKIKLEPMSVSKVIAATAVSNVLGLVNDLDGIKKIALEYAAVSIIDASQIISKRQLNLSGFYFVFLSWHFSHKTCKLSTSQNSLSTNPGRSFELIKLPAGWM